MRVAEDSNSDLQKAESEKTAKRNKVVVETDIVMFCLFAFETSDLVLMIIS